MATLSTHDLLEDTFKLLDGEDQPKKKTKDFTAEEHLKAQKKIDSDNNPLITQLQREARERTFLGSSSSSETPKKRGRPPKSTPPTTPVRPKTPPPPPSKTEAVKPDQTRFRRIKQIYAFFKLYPHLIQVVGTTNLSGFDLPVLDQILALCKSEASQDGEGNLEYAAISRIFFGALYYFENICAFVRSSFPDEETVVGKFLKFLASNPPGSFSQYIQLCNEAGSGVELELREIAIDFIDLFPNNVYFRLITKIGYKIWDFHVYKTNDYVQKMHEQMSQAAATNNPEIQKRLSSLKKRGANKV